MFYIIYSSKTQILSQLSSNFDTICSLLRLLFSSVTRDEVRPVINISENTM